MRTDCVGWGRMASCADSYESEGRLFESAWAHLEVRALRSY
jgi:hypothetical protein